MAEGDIVSISCDGDAILIVQDELQEQCIKLRVNSRMLQAASKVFQAMFGPDFAEGQQLDEQHPPEISLQDDPSSLKIICEVLHFRNRSLPNSLAAHDVLKLAQTVDKYELQEAMRLAMKMWLVPTSVTRDLFVLLQAAILLRDESNFEAITRSLILNCGEPFINANTCRPDDDRMWNILFALEQKRTALRMDMSNIIFSQARSISAGCQCDWMCALASRFMQKVDENRVTPANIAQVSIAQALSRLEKMEDPVIPTDRDESCSGRRWHTDARSIREALRCQMERLKAFKGLQMKDMELGPPEDQS